MSDIDLSKSIEAMLSFLAASREQSQEDILKRFHELVLHAGHFSEGGSVLIDHTEQRKLRLFDPEFLTKNGYLKAGEPWQVEFEYGQGIAGEAFNLRDTIRVVDVARDARFSI